MTAATTPPKPGDWSWPLKPSSSSSSNPAPPLELQFLPPSSAAMAAATRPSRASPWTIDPSHLQKLMMGSIATPHTTLPSTPAPVSNSSSASDWSASFDPGITKPLPSGWERCLDLKSGEVFIKKSDTIPKSNGAPHVLQVSSPPHFTLQCKQAGIGLNRFSDTSIQVVDEQRPDWFQKWMQGKTAIQTVLPRKTSKSFSNVSAKLCGDEEKCGSPDKKHMCLDLDLRLTSENRSSRLNISEAVDVTSSQSVKVATFLPYRGRDISSSQSRVQPWKWPACSNEKQASIQEMVSESTMATAVCSKCLMYVLLKKSNPTCPRCLNPIILDCVLQLPPATKKPRLELSPDDFSLSTDSSR